MQYEYYHASKFILEYTGLLNAEEIVLKKL
jgi:hypothetical protein